MICAAFQYPPVRGMRLPQGWVPWSFLKIRLFVLSNGSTLLSVLQPPSRMDWTLTKLA